MKKAKYKRGDIVCLGRRYLRDLTTRSEQACAKLMRPYLIVDVLFERDFNSPNVYLVAPLTNSIGPTVARLNSIAYNPDLAPASVLVSDRDSGTLKGLLMVKAVFIAEQDIYDLYYNNDNTLLKIKTLDRFGLTRVRTGEKGRIRLSQEAIAKQLKFAPDMSSLSRNCHTILKEFAKLDALHEDYKWTEPFNVSANLVATKYNILEQKLTKQYLNIAADDRRYNDVNTRSDPE